MVRIGQPYFVNSGRAWPEEPLLEATEMDTCRVCLGTEVILNSYPSWEESLR